MLQILQNENLVFTQIDICSETDLVFLNDISFEEFIRAIVEMVLVRIPFPEQIFYDGLIPSFLVNFFQPEFHIRVYFNTFIRERYPGTEAFHDTFDIGILGCKQSVQVMWEDGIIGIYESNPFAFGIVDTKVSGCANARCDDGKGAYPCVLGRILTTYFEAVVCASVID